MEFPLLAKEGHNQKAAWSQAAFRDQTNLRLSSGLFLRFRRGGLPLDIFFPTCPFDRFIVLLAHSSLHSLGIPIWYVIL